MTCRRQAQQSARRTLVRCGERRRARLRSPQRTKSSAGLARAQRGARSKSGAECRMPRARERELPLLPPGARGLLQKTAPCQHPTWVHKSHPACFRLEEQEICVARCGMQAEHVARPENLPEMYRAAEWRGFHAGKAHRQRMKGEGVAPARVSLLLDEIPDLLDAFTVRFDARDVDVKLGRHMRHGCPARCSGEPWRPAPGAQAQPSRLGLGALFARECNARRNDFWAKSRTTFVLLAKLGELRLS
jgi:hypothetical protein